MITKSLLIICYLFSLFGCADRAGTDKAVVAGGIIQGEPVAPGSEIANQTVLIVQNYEYRDQKPNLFGLCTGIIIDTQTILTAAHCLSSGIEKMKIIYTVNPRESLRKKKDIYSPTTFLIHENYLNKDELDKKISTLKTSAEKANALIENADLALIYLDRPLEKKYNTDIFQTDDFKISESENIPIGVSGYGKTTALQDTSKIKFEELNGSLRTAQLLIKKENLNQVGFYLDQREKPGICHGDSGAPAFASDENGRLKLVAMAVNVFEINDRLEQKLNKDNKYSACGSHGLYLNLDNYRGWINSTNYSLKRNSQ